LRKKRAEKSLFEKGAASAAVAKKLWRTAGLYQGMTSVMP
jgi:hypothetical protein